MARKRGTTPRKQPAVNKTDTEDNVSVNAALLRKLLFSNGTSTLPPSSRMDFARKAGTYSQFSGNRNIREIVGYPDVLVYADYLAAYERQDVATRVIETYPDYTWISKPEIYETEGSTDTPFEVDIKNLVRKTDVIGVLRAFDILAGIGEYGVLVIGVDDGGKMDTLLTPKKAAHKIIYMRPYAEGEVKVKEWDTNTNSERYMHPVMYTVTPNELQTTTMPAIVKTFDVHYSRTIHFADNALNSTVFGVPRLKRVYDRLVDILKIVAGSGEMFWRGAYQGFAFEADAEGELTTEDKTAMKDDIQRYLMGLDRAMLLKGVQAKPLSPAVASPKDHLDAQLTMVAIASRIPKRILAGSEMGKLASTQDAENWSQQITTRRTNVTEPRLLRPFIDFCTTNRIIASPQGEYNVIWAALTAPSDKDVSETAMNFTNALSTYATASLYLVMPFKEYLMNIWRYTVEQANIMSKGFDAKAFEKIKAAQNEPKQVKTPANTKGETEDT